jgi:KUP system potassium uptake protein
MRECFHGSHAVPATHDNVLGVLSLIFWSLIIVISIKYLVFVLRADNRGEGGILALMALASPRRERSRGATMLLVVMGLFGAALLYGDGMITPAITVLGALEGLEVATPIFRHWVVPLAILILVGLFVIQRRGTAGIGAMFGPVMMVWFVVLAALGVHQMMRNPEVFSAVNPFHGARFFYENGWHGFLVLGSVFLVVTGGEALYADMGHFGARPIRLAWFTIVLPALTLNYFGQGALLLNEPDAAEQLFYRMAPEWALYPLVVLSTVAACIASQAVISGSYSLTRQAVQLGYAPRLAIEHTSAREIGQIYIPSINWWLMGGTIGLVLFFRSSSNLAAAYGVAVTATMAITTVLLFVVARDVWGWDLWKVITMTVVFLVIDLAFFGANIIKVAHGGWFPLLLAALIFTLMTTWRKGRGILNAKLRETTLPIENFLKSIERHPPTRVRGTAVFMSRTPEGTPLAMLHNLKHNKVLHERVVFLTVLTEEVPVVSRKSRWSCSDLGAGFYQVIVRYGFMEDPDIPEVLTKIDTPGVSFPPAETTYFLGKETILPTKHPGMAIWREKLFGIMTRNAGSATSFFRLPPNRVVELGAQIEM